MCIQAFPRRKMKAISNVCKQYNLKCLRGSSTNGQFHVKAWFSSLTKCKLKITIIHSSLVQHFHVKFSNSKRLSYFFLTWAWENAGWEGSSFRWWRHGSITAELNEWKVTARNVEEKRRLMQNYTNEVEWNGMDAGEASGGGLIIIKDMHFDAVRF